MPDKVQLYVYDLSAGMARSLSSQVLGKQIAGIWHTSIVVGGIEYYFSAGVQSAAAGNTHFGLPEKVIDLGVTEIPKEVREELIRDMSGRFTPETYNLINNNCNNFSDELSTMLTGNGIPADILSMPSDVLSTPMGQMLRPFLDQLQGQLGNITEGPVSQPVASTAAPKQEERPSPSVPRDVPLETPKDHARGDSHESKTEVADSNGKAVFEAALKREFAALMAGGGLTPNQAAAMALQRVREQLQGHTMSGTA